MGKQHILGCWNPDIFHSISVLAVNSWKLIGLDKLLLALTRELLRVWAFFGHIGLAVYLVAQVGDGCLSIPCDLNILRINLHALGQKHVLDRYGCGIINLILKWIHHVNRANKFFNLFVIQLILWNFNANTGFIRGRFAVIFFYFYNRFSILRGRILRYVIVSLDGSSWAMNLLWNICNQIHIFF